MAAYFYQFKLAELQKKPKPEPPPELESSIAWAWHLQIRFDGGARWGPQDLTEEEWCMRDALVMGKNQAENEHEAAQT